MVNDGRVDLQEQRRDKGNYDFVLLDFAMPRFIDVKDIFNKLKEENMWDTKNIVIHRIFPKGQRNAKECAKCISLILFSLRSIARKILDLQIT